MNLKNRFLNELYKITWGEEDIAIALSSGIDSHAVLFGLLELNKNITAYTVHIDGVLSQDFIHAKKNAEEFNIKFVDCIIPKQLNIDIIFKIIYQYKKYKKVDVECIYPFYFIFPNVKEKIMVTGACSDGHFCLSKKGMIHYKHSIEKLHEFRNSLYNNQDYAQAYTLSLIAKEEFNLYKLDNPFNKKMIVDYFYDKTWDEINRPKQKQPIIDMFPEQFNKIKIFNHTNLQCGDSNIRELFEPLLKDKNINKKSRKRVLDLYRDIYNAKYK